MRYANKTERELAIKRQPPLSNIDKAILIVIGVIGMAGAGGLMGMWLYKIRRLAFLEPGVVAAVETADCFWLLPGFFLCFFWGLFGFVGVWERYALFGLPGAVYQGSEYRDILGYPLFMELSDAPEQVTGKIRRERRLLAGFLVALAVSLCCVPMSWQGRACLYLDGTLRVYSGTGQVRTDCAPEEVDRLIIRITPPRSGRYGQANYELELVARGSDGKPWRFEEKNLAGTEPEEYLSWLIDLKQTYGPEVVRLENADRVNALINDRGYDADVLWLLYELYDLRGQILS
ncbi:MAG: hypothetical protein IJN47_01050 [Clostridia bacterium]|nr:hypothetical protein [Clostridia bacterium]